jgi:energy-coupling factor transporter ATP-binding protein EcfA2
MQHIVRVDFDRFKAYKSFRLDLRHFNILVGPNNAGKSTIITAFRILAAGLRTARAKSGQIVRGFAGGPIGHKIDLTNLSVAGENVFYNYDDSVAATVTFTLSDGKTLTLWFPETDTCYLMPSALGPNNRAPSDFRKRYDVGVGFVPVLGPVDHDEQLFNPETARRALFNYRAARNFRNIWYHFPEPFPKFQRAIRETWPGMDVALPEAERIGDKVLLKMYCPEERIDREIVWSGFGFQVWCQMLTHLVQGRDNSIFLIDEPDIYLHSDLQRQLVGLLRDLGPDIVIATHSTEIVTEAEPGELVVINKKKARAKRIQNQEEVGSVFNDLGSNVNPILTQLAKTKTAVIVEGLDFQNLTHFARRLGYTHVANRAKFAVIPLEGFNPGRAQILKEGIELTLGSAIETIVILDRDYRSKDEVDAIKKQAAKFCGRVVVHDRKEIENFLLCPTAIERAVKKRVEDRHARGAEVGDYDLNAESLIDRYAEEQRAYVQSRHIALRQRFAKSSGSGTHPDQVTQDVIVEFDRGWAKTETRHRMIPGKDALSQLNRELQENLKISVTPSAIVSAMTLEEVPAELKSLIKEIDSFSRS